MLCSIFGNRFLVPIGDLTQGVRVRVRACVCVCVCACVRVSVNVSSVFVCNASLYSVYCSILFPILLYFSFLLWHACFSNIIFCLLIASSSSRLCLFFSMYFPSKRLHVIGSSSSCGRGVSSVH